ncbi:DUF4827 family protein [Dysgonomonas sp. 216]|uniref:DUF4827 family protein n=1 Tax=Dysgonomonas sp. 216 TaxID=2302934 RepID=UPI0013D388FD|nr:DUF4827 family protein [Dysgonomonas sp. 216]NDW17699.1 DUF4827 family protein [Dysgonomonas sp. 216]
MKKLISGIVLLIFISIIAASCSKTETYADKLKSQSKAISRLMNDSGFYTTSSYPTDRPFDEGEFFSESNHGVFFHVIDSGNGNRAEQGTEVTVRIRGTYRLLSDAITDSTAWDNTRPGFENEYMNFTYGNTSTYKYSSSAYGVYNYMFTSTGLTVPLSYVGENAIIKMIVPFGVGSAYQSNYYDPVYFGYIKYEFSKKQGEVEIPEAEQKAINDLIADSGIIVLNEYPSDGVFAENEFYYHKRSGVYFNVVDEGYGRQIDINDRQKVQVTHSNTTRPMFDATAIFSNEADPDDIISFYYGQASTYTEKDASNGYSNYTFKSKGMTIPLGFVRNGAIVKMIVPSISGSTVQKLNEEFVYFGKIQYSFDEE